MVDVSLTEEFAAVICDLESLVEPPETGAGGSTHNLEEAFERVNRDYFGGAMDKPSLCWNRTPTFCNFGHDQFMRDRVTIASVLDEPAVPEFVVDFLLYHELLHKKHGLTKSGNRNYAHTPAFRRDEHKFARINEVKKFIDDYALRLRRR